MVERVELKIGGMYQAQDSPHHRKYILYFHGKYIKSQRLTFRVTTDLFLVTLQRAVTLHPTDGTPLIPAEESIQTATAYLVLYQLRSVGILCRVCRTTRRHTRRPSSQCYHLEQFHTHSFDQHLHRQNHVPSELPAPLC